MFRAVNHLNGANYDRFVRLVEVSQEQAPGLGESDLRRLKRQFASLKNTFMLYDVKQSFFEGKSHNLASYKGHCQWTQRNLFGMFKSSNKASVNLKNAQYLSYALASWKCAFWPYSRHMQFVTCCSREHSKLLPKPPETVQVWQKAFQMAQRKVKSRSMKRRLKSRVQRSRSSKLAMIWCVTCDFISWLFIVVEISLDATTLTIYFAKIDYTPLSSQGQIHPISWV